METWKGSLRHAPSAQAIICQRSGTHSFFFTHVNGSLSQLAVPIRGPPGSLLAMSEWSPRRVPAPCPGCSPGWRPPCGTTRRVGRRRGPLNTRPHGLPAMVTPWQPQDRGQQWTVIAAGLTLLIMNEAVSRASSSLEGLTHLYIRFELRESS